MLEKALKNILTDKSNYNVKRNFKLVNGNVIDDEIIKTIPIYMAFLIR